MKNLKQKIFAILMISVFMMSLLPSCAVAAKAKKKTAVKKTAAKKTTSVAKKSTGASVSQNEVSIGVALRGDQGLKNGSKRLSVSLRESDVKQTLRMFADKAGLNIIFHNSVEGGTVTLDLVGVTLEDALRMVMQATDLAYFVDGQTMVVMSAEKSKELNISKQRMMILPVKYADAMDIADFLNKNVFAADNPGLSNTQVVSVNPARNELIILGTPSDYSVAKKILESLDIPVRITTFKVNHVTPAEMANNICTSLLKNYTEDEGSDEEDEEDDEEESTSSSSSGGTSASSLSAASTSKVKLGKMQIACVTGNVKEKESESKPLQPGQAPYSLNQNAIKVVYFTSLGIVNVIGGSPQQIETISSFVKASDIQQQMAYLEISIIELSETGSKTFQNDWSLITNNIGIEFVNGALGTTVGGIIDPTAAVRTVIPWLGEKVGSEGMVNVQQYFQYLIQSTKSKVLSNPKIMVTSGKESVIDLSEDYIKKVSYQSTTGVSTYTNKNYDIGKDEGIVVRMTPYISRDGYITMNISPNYATQADQYFENNVPIVTLLSRRNLELKDVRIKDGETLVIGGLMEETESEQIAKIPLLGDIPVLGFFFRNTSTVKEKNELVILITPHIIKDSTDIVSKENNNL